MKITIIEAIRSVLLPHGCPLTVSEVYEAIIAAKLYVFNSDQPVHVVRSQIRRHCKGVDIPSASSLKHFELLSNGKYYLLDAPPPERGMPLSSSIFIQPKTSADSALRQIHQEYLADFRERTLKQLKGLDPGALELFCKNLLTVYGFRDVAVTRISRDGGIDGHGRLKVGFAYFNVAFPYKRWTGWPVGRPELDQFRGAIQGQYDQGVFFTTANFSHEAEGSSFKSGAVPIVLINGSTLIDIMIEHGFGIEVEYLPVYGLAIDLAVSVDWVKVQ